MLTAHDATRETALPPRVQRIRILLLVPHPRIAAPASVVDEVASRDVAGTFTRMTVTGTTTHVIEYRNAHPTGREVAHLLGVKSGMFETTVISTGETATIGDSLESTTPILARRVLPSPAYAHWIHTVAQVLLICDIFQVHLQDPRPTHRTMHLPRIDWVRKETHTRGDLHLLLSLSPPRMSAGSQAKTKPCWLAVQRRLEKGMPHVLRHLLLPFQPLVDPMFGGHPFLIANRVLFQ